MCVCLYVRLEDGGLDYILSTSQPTEEGVRESLML